MDSVQQKSEALRGRMNDSLKNYRSTTNVPFLKGTRLAPGAAGSSYRVPFKDAPPPPPQRPIPGSQPPGASAGAKAPPPPPRSTRPTPVASHIDARHGPPTPQRFKPFSQYTAADKAAFFALLDEYFGQPAEKRKAADGTGHAVAATGSSRETTGNTRDTTTQTAGYYGSPPPYAASTSASPATPAYSRAAVSANTLNRQSSSGAGEAQSSCHAEAAAVSLRNDTSQWYLETKPIPPPLRNREDLQYTYSWRTRGPERTETGSAVFGDLSRLWWSVGPLREGSRSPAVLVAYKGPPREPNALALYYASEKYGTLVAEFAQEAADSHTVIGSGECWDLANDALVSVAEVFDAEEPTDLAHGPCLPSIARTHGHRLCSGDASGFTWTAADGYIRPGDIVEWRTVVIRTQDMPPNAHMTLGSPEHTAVVLSASVPATPFAGPGAPADLGLVTVVEQSRGHAPSINTYDMGTLSQGSFAFYRPVSQFHAGLPLHPEMPAHDRALIRV